MDSWTFTSVTAFFATGLAGSGRIKNSVTYVFARVLLICPVCTSSLKKELIKKRIYKTRDIAKADIFDYIEHF